MKLRSLFAARDILIFFYPKRDIFSKFLFSTQNVENTPDGFYFKMKSPKTSRSRQSNTLNVEYYRCSSLSFSLRDTVKNDCLFFCNDYTFSISTDILTLMKIYFLLVRVKGVLYSLFLCFESHSTVRNLSNQANYSYLDMLSNSFSAKRPNTAFLDMLT